MRLTSSKYKISNRAWNIKLFDEICQSETRLRDRLLTNNYVNVHKFVGRTNYYIY